MSKNKISWCTATWNPIVGCSKCSPGCKNCYAERMAKRLRGMSLPQYQDVVDKNGWTGKTMFSYGHLPKKPSLVFVSSMGDFFHESVSDQMLSNAFSVMCENQQHTFILLTKRPERMLNYINQHLRSLPNKLWCGVTVCNQEEADKKIPVLLDVWSNVRLVSIEPMLGPVDLYRGGFGFLEQIKSPQGIQHEKLDWVICGGESGPGARPIKPEWVRQIRDQCVEAGVPFHFKQWGGHIPKSMEEKMSLYLAGYSLVDKNGGTILDGRRWKEFPE